jgi:lipopolysaccharide export system protein LptA
MTQPKFHLIAAVFVALMSLSHQALALPEDRDKPITGKASKQTLNANTGQTTLTGNVQIRQGNLTILADEVTLETDPITNDLRYMIATGNPVRFSDLPNADEALVEISGRQIEFFPMDNQVITLGKAVIVQGGNRASGERIKYDTVTGIMTIESEIIVNETPDGEQAEFIIQPGTVD